MKVGTVRKKDISDFNETILDFIGTPPGKKREERLKSFQNKWNLQKHVLVSSVGWKV
jgi:hypothetical protein